MLDIRMKDENTSWQEWYEENPRPRKYKSGSQGLTYGVGINDLPYVVKLINRETKPWVEVYYCKFYATWEKMLQMAYSAKYSTHHPTYKGVCVSDEFLSAKYFSEWMSTHITVEGGETLHLDKDILYPGNKTYSPSTCAFVPAFINNCIHICENSDGTLMRGVKRYLVKGGSFRYAYSISAACRNKVRKGGFISEALAHKEWQLKRADMIEDSIAKYKLMACYREDVAYAVEARADKLRYDAKFGLETTRLA